MRLSSINEAFSRRDFFDLYSLLYASSDLSNNNDQDIKRLTRFYVNYVWEDLLNQLSSICVLRFSNIESISDKNLARVWLPILQQLDDVYLNNSDTLPGQDIEEEQSVIVKRVPLYERIKLLLYITENKIDGHFAEDTWRGIATEIVKAADSNTLHDKIIAVDRLMNMLHHDGEIIEFLDERAWLSEALNYRDNANPAQLAKYASGQVRQAIRNSSFIGMERSRVPDTKLLATSLRRAAIRYGNFRAIADEKTIEVSIHGTFYEPRRATGGWTKGPIESQNLHRLQGNIFGDGLVRWFHLGGPKPEFSVDGENIPLIKQEKANSTIVGAIEDGDLYLTDEYENTIVVNCPIRDYRKITGYIIEWLMQSVLGERYAKKHVEKYANVENTDDEDDDFS